MPVNNISAVDVVISIGPSGSEKVVGCWTQAQLNVSREELDIACAATAGFKGRAPGVLDVTLQLDMRYRLETGGDTETTLDDFMDLILSNSPFADVSFKTNVTGGSLYAGNFMLQSNNITANSTNGETSGSVSFAINGPLTKSAVTVTP